MGTAKRGTSNADDGTLRAVPAFDRIAAVLRDEGGVDTPSPAASRRAYGAGALKAGGRIFAMPAQGTVVLKLPAARVEELIASGRGQRFDPGHGRVMREWIALAGGEEDWLPLAREARAFVGG